MTLKRKNKIGSYSKNHINKGMTSKRKIRQTWKLYKRRNIKKKNDKNI